MLGGIRVLQRIILVKDVEPLKRLKWLTMCGALIVAPCPIVLEFDDEHHLRERNSDAEYALRRVLVCLLFV